MQSDGVKAGEMTTEGSPYGAEVDAIAKRILDRDHQLIAGVRYWWFATGKDLNEAKARIPHGQFESWCQSQLNYSKSKAEKLMRTVSMFRDQLESVKVTEFPKPSSLYLLSAPSVPQALRDEFVPRIIAGESVGFEVKQAIKTYHNEVERSPGDRAKLTAARANREAAKARTAKRDAAKREAQNIVQAKAKTVALAFLAARLGDELSTFLRLAREAGSGAVLSYGAERELTARSQAVDAQEAEIEGTVLPVGKPGSADEEATDPHYDLATSSEPVGAANVAPQPVDSDDSARIAERDPGVPIDADAASAEHDKELQAALGKSSQTNPVVNKLASPEQDQRDEVQSKARAAELENYLFPNRPIRSGVNKR